MNAPLALASPTTPTFPDIELSEALVRRFDISGPRYTSYPTADRFSDAYAGADHIETLRERASSAAPPPLSVYVHVPFCESLCYFCACNKIITRDHSRAEKYLRYLEIEMERIAAHLGAHRRTCQLHLGGGTPTFLSMDELGRLMCALRRHFDLEDDAELGVEIDPRTVNDETLAGLGALGFNRTSFGVQDFDPCVQVAVNRIQPLEMVEQALSASRQAGFRSINMDLIYGLPKQTLESFSRTLDQLIRLSPDRIALYNYAHLPSRFKAQRLIHAEDLPSVGARLKIFMMSVQRLLEAGYVTIGLDHFAKPDDELNIARLNNGLHRNFQGYTTRAECDLIGLGVSAIGKVGDTYSQSVRSLNAYYAALDQDRLPIERGLRLSPEDVLRREIIMALMCSMPVDFDALERRHGFEFEAHFLAELERLEPFVEAGLLQRGPRSLQVTPQGRFFVRGLGMVFDQYLGRPTAASYSRLI